jgi:hypothetical protein
VKYVIGYAGIPHDYFDAVVEDSNMIRGGDQDIEFYAKTLPLNQTFYTQQYAMDVRRFFSSRLANNRKSYLETSFAVVYVNNATNNADVLVNMLLPNIFTIPVEWVPAWGSSQVRRDNQNILIRAFADATRKVKRVLPHIHKELTERANRTPLLLPLKNFDGDEISNLLASIHAEALIADNPTMAIRAIVRDFERRFPSELDTSRKPPQTRFTNRQNIRFRAPGKDRHGSAHPETAGHPDHCILAAFKRLGAPYDPNFHYDCTHLNQSRLSAQLHNCHRPRGWITSTKRHLNIAPNDAVR